MIRLSKSGIKGANFMSAPAFGFAFHFHKSPAIYTKNNDLPALRKQKKSIAPPAATALQQRIARAD
jgi:hypothetical protein